MPDQPLPTELDRLITELVRSELAACPPEVAVVTAEVAHPETGTYVTRIRPAGEGAAALSLGFDGCSGGSTLFATIGRTDFQVAPFGAGSLPYLREIVAAVLTGGVEEISRGSSSYLRLHLAEGRVVVTGAPTTPWRRKRVHRYGPYSGG